MVTQNRMRTALERGEVQIGTWITTLRDPVLLMLLKAASLDFARIDMEHTGLSIDAIAAMAAMARALDFPIAVRPPVSNREWITRLLDVGIWNLHCPQVETADQAAEIVAASRYAPLGQRGMGGLGVATNFEAGGSPAERRAFANSQVFVTVMLETEGAFAHLDAIAAMEGIDALTLGPHDLAQDMGLLGSPDQARIIDEKRQLILAAARKHGKICAMLVSSADQARRWRQAGALLLAYSSEVEMLQRSFSQAMVEMKGDQ
jgi:2-keto-3-deoxy-L-rhamnonate aldolase RhmA